MTAYGARNRATDERFPAAGAQTRVEQTHDASPLADARSLQADLAQGLHDVAEEAKPPQGDSTPAAAAPGGSLTRRLVKVALGLSLVGSLGWAPLRAMLTTTSVEALVNARVETIRSPIEGVVDSVPDGARDWRASGAAPRLRVVDPLADHARLDDLRRQRRALEAEALMLERESAVTKAALETLDAQIEKFREGRLRLLDARLATQKAEIAAAAARASEAAAAKRRVEQLSKSGTATAAESDRRLYEWLAASSTEAAEQERLDETRVERDAIVQGVFVGDSYNDSPSSEQRAAELKLKAGDLDARAAADRSQVKLLDDQIAEEEARFHARSEALVELPSSGRVWEMLTAPGERVGKGQDLMRVLDCSRPLVSANVDETVYNRLEVGGRATFRPSRRGAETYNGVIVNLTGEAAASGNFAIPPAAMRKSPFYVTVALDGMNEGGCSVGRTGTVTFSSKDEARSAVAAGEGRLASLRAAPF